MFEAEYDKLPFHQQLQLFIHSWAQRLSDSNRQQSRQNKDFNEYIIEARERFFLKLYDLDNRLNGMFGPPQLDDVLSGKVPVPETEALMKQVMLKVREKIGLQAKEMLECQTNTKQDPHPDWRSRVLAPDRTAKVDDWFSTTVNNTIFIKPLPENFFASPAPVYATLLKRLTSCANVEECAGIHIPDENQLLADCAKGALQPQDMVFLTAARRGDKSRFLDSKKQLDVETTQRPMKAIRIAVDYLFSKDSAEQKTALMLFLHKEPITPEALFNQIKARQAQAAPQDQAELAHKGLAEMILLSTKTMKELCSLVGGLSKQTLAHFITDHGKQRIGVQSEMDIKKFADSLDLPQDGATWLKDHCLRIQRERRRSG